MKVKESTIRPMGVACGLSTLHTIVAGKKKLFVYRNVKRVLKGTKSSMDMLRDGKQG